MIECCQILFLFTGGTIGDQRGVFWRLAKRLDEFLVTESSDDVKAAGFDVSAPAALRFLTTQIEARKQDWVAGGKEIR